MNENLCRTCLAPQGKIKHSSMFTDNGKIANDIFKLTNLVILDLIDINCPALICQRCLMDLERAISFRNLVINSDDHFTQSCRFTTNKVVEKLVNQVKMEFYGKIRSKTNLNNVRNAPKSIKKGKMSKNRKSPKLSQSDENCDQVENSLQSIVKMEQYETICISNRQDINEPSSKESKIQQSPSLSQQSHITENNVKKIGKVRQKTTKMRPDPANVDEEYSNFKIVVEILDKNEQNSNENDSPGCSQIFNDNAEINQDYLGQGHLNKFSPNHEDSFHMKMTPNSIKLEQIQQNHIKISTQKSKKRQIISNYSYQNSSSNNLECHICLKTFSKKCYLTQHFQTIHMTLKTHKCKKCGKKFANVEELSQHEDKHVADKPFKCPCCPKAFVYKSDLKRHEIGHSVKKPFQCSLCPRGFVRNDHLLKHKLVHQKKVKRRLKKGVVKEEIFGM